MDMPEDNSDSTKPCMTRSKSPAKFPALSPEVKSTSEKIADEKEIDDRISPARGTRIQRILIKRNFDEFNRPGRG